MANNIRELLSFITREKARMYAEIHHIRFVFLFSSCQANTAKSSPIRQMDFSKSSGPKMRVLNRPPRFLSYHQESSTCRPTKFRSGRVVEKESIEEGRA